MKRSRRSNRFYTRTRRLPFADQAKRHRGAAGAALELAASAGMAERAVLEPLEARQLLFSLTIGPGDVDPTTGVGTVFATFGYVIPYLNTTEEPETSDPETVIEDFNDEENVPRGLPSPTVFDGSNLQLLHTIAPDLVTGAPRANLVGTGDENSLRLGFAAGETFTLRATSNEQGQVALPVRQMQMFINGLDADNTLVELRLGGQVVGSFTGAELEALGPAGGVGVWTFQPTTLGAFDTITFTSLPGAPSATLTIDNVSWTTSSNPFASIIESRIFGARVAFTGPVGATVQFLDLYGRDMVQTLALGTPQGAEVVLVDPDGDGVPNFNDGIGKIIITASDSRTSLTLFGGTIQSEETGFVFELVDSLMGIFDEFESAGFGYAFGDDGATGLPPGPGSVIVGSPFVRPQDNYNAAGTAPGPRDFNRTSQGVFVQGGRNVGTIYIHGVVHGNSQFTGAVDRIAVGYLVGSIGVNGDLGSLLVGSDAGTWELDPEGDPPPPGQDTARVKTGSQLSVGRTLGEVVIAGRSTMDVTVVGDVNSPTTRPARDVYRYYEREAVFGINPNVENPELVMINAMLARNSGHALNQLLADGSPFFNSTQGLLFAEGTFRNDTIMGAEFLNSITTGVQIYGTLGAQDPSNPNEDLVDVYGFATSGQRPVVVELQAINEVGVLELMYARIVDHDGRTLAAMPVEITAGRTQRLVFEAPAPGAYYLVLTALAPENDIRPNVAYTVTMGGLASVALGAHRTGSSFGSNQIALSSSISVLAGGVGSIRVATGYVNSDATDTDPIGIFNDDEEVLDERQTYLGSTISVAGTLYNVTAGGDIVGGAANPVRIIVGGDFGGLVTGLSPVTGVGPDQGDLGPFNLQVGGRIGLIDVKGGIGINSDADPDSLYAPDTVVIRSGTAGGNGDIGMIRVGGHVAAGRLTVATSNSSTVGAFLVSQDIEYDPADDDIGIYNIAGNGSGVRWNLGAGSDVRFADTPRIDMANTVDAFIPLIGGQFVDITDDAGEAVRIQVIGAANGVAVGRIITIPINSGGVAIAQIIVDLSGGARLQITGRGQAGSTDVFSIGRIVVTNADAASSIGIVGNDEIDVWMIHQTGGTGLVDIINSTPRGDIVAIDVAGLTNLTITTGDLGRTQLPAWGPRRIGPFLGIGGEAGGGGNLAPIELDPALIDDSWNGELYRPVNDATVEPGDAFLDDLGSPVNPYLNGLIVRSGDINRVSVGGAVGDVIAQAGNIITVTADADGVTPQGRFDGIVGVIAAFGGGETGGGDITVVTIGDGLAERAPSPLSTTGIFASDDIERVQNDAANPDAFISSTIAARNINNAEEGSFELENGIFLTQLTGGGDYINAFISVGDLDRFWGSLLYGHDDDLRHGIVFNVLGTGADFFRSDVVGSVIATFRLTGGFFDASRLRAVTSIGTVEATGFRNSTISGSDAEFQINSITSGGDLGALTTTSMQGDIQDLVLDILGSITTEISARNLSRVDFDVDNTIALLRTQDDLRGSRVTAGQLADVRIGRDVRNSIINAAGSITSFTANNSILNTTINVTGPNGRIIRLTARNNITGDISATGSIGSIIATNGHIIGSISTGGGAGAGSGDVDLLQAGLDLDIQTDIAGDVNRLVAGRHIGGRNNSDHILIRGDLGEADARNGQLFTDLRIGGNVTGDILLGGAVNKPGQRAIGTGSIIAFGRISNVEIGGDFGGDIISHSGGIGTVLIEDGSFLPGALIAAYDGNITRVTIDGGNLYGDIHADYILTSIVVRADSRGVFGDIGVNPEHSSGDRYDGRRNELPPGVAADPTYQGPRITAGHNLGRVTVENGSIFEGFFYAGRAIGTILVENGNITNDDLTPGFGTVIAAGSLIYRVLVSGDVSDAQIISGILDFGSDGRAGGTGAAADTVNRGRIILVDIGDDARNVVVASGMHAGADGEYNTADDRVAPGRSMIGRVLVDGDATNVSAYTDLPTAILSDGVERGGISAPNLDPDIVQGVPAVSTVQIPGNGSNFSFTWQGSTGRISFTGPGRAYWDSANGRVILINTNNDSSLTVTSNSGTLNDFDIVTNDDASIGTIIVNSDLTGDSDIVIDGFSLLIRTGAFSGTGDIRAGMNIRQLTTGSFTSTGVVQARWINRFDVNGNFGSTAQPNDADSRVDILAGRTIAVAGVMSGAVNVDRSINFRAGTMDRGNLRVGDRIVTFRADSVSQSHISANNRIEDVQVAGDVFDSSFLAGGDLGADAMFGGGDDRATTGSVGSVSIGGDFIESDIAVGVLRGVDGFFGTGDDVIAAGRGSIDRVTIAGTQVGSNLSSEQYRIAATGDVGNVTIGGQPPANNTGNFRVESLETEPLPIRVRDIAVTWEGGVYVAHIQFNQDMEGSSIAPALTISEVREGGLTLLQLQQGTDYTVSYDAQTRTAVVTFAREITDRDLNPDGTQTNLPGPGIYRFNFEHDILRAAVSDARLDGDADGVADPNDDFSADAVVGDAGDKLVPERATDDEGNVIDFYGPVDLDLLLDQNANPDGLPETNVVTTIRGVIGDHPDNNTSGFRFAGDADVYAITLRAGQVLRLGKMTGSGAFAGRFLVNADGELQGGVTPDSLSIATNAPELFELTGEDGYFIKTTGTYYLVVANSFAFDLPGVVPDPSQTAGATGDYAFSLEIFDDFDSGFAGDTNSGDGAPVVNAPNPGAFAGNDGVLGTDDDLRTVSIRNFTFRLEDGVVTGTNGNGSITSVRRANGTRYVTINSAIGPEDHRGVPADNITPDVDVYHFNNRQEVQPGTRYRITVQLSREGADLGSRRQGRLEGTDFDTSFDFSGNVQLGLFDTTGATNISDALLVFSPSDFSPIGGTPGEIADNGTTAYGYDENGDFYIEFVTPGRVDAEGNTTPASYAVYVQGIFNSNYTLQIEQFGTKQIERTVQNIFIETGGGLIQWLKAGGLTTTLDGFDASSLGFTGSVGGLPAQQYILQRLVSNLNTIFNAAGLNVRISLNSADFEFQDFSTVFITSSNDPIFAFNDRIYGVSEHSDPLNADRNDEAAVFVPSFSTLGFTPSQADVNAFTDSLTAAVGRRIGELLGLRTTSPDGTFDEVDIMASSSVENTGDSLLFPTVDRALSHPFDLLGNTNFFLGEQNAVSLLDKYLAD